MTYVVPAVLVGLALGVMALVSWLASRRGQLASAAVAEVPEARILIHSINDDRCTGCDACVAVCPTNVLDLVDNKSRVLHFQDCIQCEACMWACPTEALVMHPEGSEPPPVNVPELDAFYQTAVAGQYLIGEVAGKPLVKNAANLGRAVIEHMLREGLRPSPGTPERVDVVIVGSGPGGLSAALTCHQRGLSYLVLEKENIISSTVARYPKGKLVMAEPYEVENVSFLPVFDSTKEEMIPIWEDLIARVGLKIRMHEAVQSVGRKDGLFEVVTTGGRYRGQRVVLATGTRGKPRTLGVPGENLPKVESLLEDPDQHRGQAVCVVGGGDSALEAAVALADAGARVVLSYRGKSFHRAQPKNRQTVEAYGSERRIKVVLESEVVEFAADSVTLQLADGVQKRYPNHASFVLIGADPPIEWLSTLGIHYRARPHLQALPASDRIVRDLVRDARPCPRRAADAAALMAGEDIPELLSKDSAGRRFIRSASHLFGLGDAEEKLDGPMPLSEFAKRSRRHGGSGRRDSLPPEERTRILRMLRDEGGRRADEDSKLYLIERTDATGVQREGELPRGTADAPAMRPLPSLSSGDGSPRQAVIVGLARAEQAQQRGSGRRRPPAPPPAPSDEFEEPTHLASFDPQAMMARVSAPADEGPGRARSARRAETLDVDLGDDLFTPSDPQPAGAPPPAAEGAGDVDIADLISEELVAPDTQPDPPSHALESGERDSATRVADEPLVPRLESADLEEVRAEPPLVPRLESADLEEGGADQPLFPRLESADLGEVRAEPPGPRSDFGELDDGTQVADEPAAGRPGPRSLSEIEFDLD